MKCIFSNTNVETDEHVIPKWLQKRYNLYNQYLTIPNGTKIQYSKLKISVNSEANTNFGKIERNISKGIYNIDELYLWAFKIHIGLLFKDSQLKRNRKISNSENIFDVKDFEEQIKLFQKLYQNWKNGNKTDPISIGSVFLLESSLHNDQFDFVHCIKTNTVMICFDKKLLVVYLYDQNDALLNDIQSSWENEILYNCKNNKNIKKEETFIAQRIWACENAYHAYKRMRDIHLKETEYGFLLLRTESRIKSNYSEEEFSNICTRFGLVLQKYNNFKRNIYNYCLD